MDISEMAREMGKKRGYQKLREEGTKAFSEMSRKRWAKYRKEQKKKTLDKKS